MLIALFTLNFMSCKKDYVPADSGVVNATNTSDLYASDGTLAVQLSILPPTTPQSFIANGGTSIVQYQLTSTIGLLDISASFTATYPAIEYAYFGGVGYNYGGKLGIDPFASFTSSGSITTSGEIHYRPVDSSTSGTIAQLRMNWLSYLNYNNQSYSFNTGAAGVAPGMCLVNNIPHIMFRDPTDDTLKNGYSEIAQVDLTGDTDWVLNSLPVNLYSPNVVSIPASKLMVRSSGQKVEVTSKLFQLNPNSNAQTVLHFTVGFKHHAEKTETLKIFANVPPAYRHNTLMGTTMSPLNSFVWTDGLGKLINGSLNAKYYKEQTGAANY